MSAERNTLALRGAKSLRIKRPRIDRRRATPERAWG